MPWRFPLRENLDHEQPFPAARTRRRQDTRRLLVDGHGGFQGHIRRRHGEQFAGERNGLATVRIGQQSVVADALQPFSEDMNEEAPDELAGSERHGLPSLRALGAIVLGAERNATVAYRDNAALRDGDAMRVAREVAQNLFWPRERRLAVDDPLAIAQRSQEAGSQVSTNVELHERAHYLSIMNSVRTTFHEHRELGDVRWLRSYDDALAAAHQSSKPILLLFREVPGCSTCVDFGRSVLSNPLMVDMIETHFIPLAIHNNLSGADAEILRRFGEAAWNNPVVYFLSSLGVPIVPKLSERYDALGLHDKIVAALSLIGVEVPEFFRVLHDDLLIEQGKTDIAVFETPCFWSGETTLAQHPAVLTTEAGWIDGEEVVRVHFDGLHSMSTSLLSYAETEGFRRTTRSGFRLDDHAQYYLSMTKFAYLPLSLSQRTKINLAIPYRTQPEKYLSPKQAAWFSSPNLQTGSRSNAYLGNMRKEWERNLRTIQLT